MTIRSLMAALLLALMSVPALAYSYASPKSDPLIKGRTPFLEAVDAGDWSGAETIYKSFEIKIEGMEKADGAYLGDPGIKQDFILALQIQDPEAARAVLDRAFANQINRRLLAAQLNIEDYDVASALVVIARAFLDGLQEELSPKEQKLVDEQMQLALDAVGKPGIFGFGAAEADPQAYDAALKKILAVLEPYQEGDANEY